MFWFNLWSVQGKFDWGTLTVFLQSFYSHLFAGGSSPLQPTSSTTGQSQLRIIASLKGAPAVFLKERSFYQFYNFLFLIHCLTSVTIIIRPFEQFKFLPLQSACQPLKWHIILTCTLIELWSVQDLGILQDTNEAVNWRQFWQLHSQSKLSKFVICLSIF